jgi:ABC-type nitrate/sulfonate/bicarbonate transport system permease component
VRTRADWAPPLVAVLLLLLLWEAIVRAGLIPESSIPPASAAIGELVEEVGTTEMWKAVGNTLQGWAIGLLLAIVIGVTAGIVIGSSRWVYRALRIPIEFLRPIPSVALIPLAVLVYGSGLESKVFLAAFAATWPLLMQTLYGVQDVDPVATDTARAFGFSRGARLVRVTLPSAVPYIATGVRISAAVALILVVTAELVIGAPGLGRGINLARQGGNVELMYALILATGLLGMAVNAVFTRVERRVLHWHPSQRREVAAR